MIERGVFDLKKNQLIYGTYKKKEWDRIIAIFRENNIEFTEDVHIHVFQVMEEGAFRKYVWEFRFLVSYVTPEEERIIRRKRDLLKKLYY